MSKADSKVSQSPHRKAAIMANVQTNRTSRLPTVSSRYFTYDNTSPPSLADPPRYIFFSNATGLAPHLITKSDYSRPDPRPKVQPQTKLVPALNSPTAPSSSSSAKMTKVTISQEVELASKKAIEEVATLDQQYFKSFVQAAKDFIRDNENECSSVPRVYKGKNQKWRNLAAKFVDENGEEIWDEDRPNFTDTSLKLPEDRDALQWLSFCMIKFECTAYFRKKRIADLDAEVDAEAAKPTPPAAKKQKVDPKPKTPTSKAKPNSERKPTQSPYVSEGLSETSKTPAPDPFSDVKDFETRTRASMSAGRASAGPSASSPKAKKPFDADFAMPEPATAKSPPITPSKSRSLDEFRRSASKASQTPFEAPMDSSKLTANARKLAAAALEAQTPTKGKETPTKGKETPTKGKETPAKGKETPKAAESVAPSIKGASMLKAPGSGEASSKNLADDERDDSDDNVKEDIKDVPMTDADDPTPGDTITLQHPPGFKPKPIVDASAPSKARKLPSKEESIFNSVFEETPEDPFWIDVAAAARSTVSGSGSDSAPKTKAKTSGGIFTNGNGKVVDDTPIPFSPMDTSNSSARRNRVDVDSPASPVVGGGGKTKESSPASCVKDSGEQRAASPTSPVKDDGEMKDGEEVPFSPTFPAKEVDDEETGEKLATTVPKANGTTTSDESDPKSKPANIDDIQTANGHVNNSPATKTNGANTTPTKANGVTNTRKRARARSPSPTPTATIFFHITMPRDPPPFKAEADPTFSPATTTTEPYLPPTQATATHPKPNAGSGSGVASNSPTPEPTHILPVPLNTDFASFYGDLILSPSIANDTAAKRRLVSCRKCIVIVPKVGATKGRRYDINVFGLGAGRVWTNMLTWVGRAVEEELDGAQGKGSGEVEVQMSFEYGLQ